MSQETKPCSCDALSRVYCPICDGYCYSLCEACEATTHFTPIGENLCIRYEDCGEMCAEGGIDV